jgi:hypothetical protein
MRCTTLSLNKTQDVNSASHSSLKTDDLQVWSESLVATYVKLSGNSNIGNAFAGTVTFERLPVPTRKLDTRSLTWASIWLNVIGR